jgi:hypothetical protein
MVLHHNIDSSLGNFHILIFAPRLFKQFLQASCDEPGNTE